MKVLMCGDRNWSDQGRIYDIVLRLRRRYGDVEIVHGDCRGADRIAGSMGKNFHLKVHAHPAEWYKYGKRAGPLRNQAMLDAHPDIAMVVAFHDDIDASRGTRDMVERARKAGIPTHVIRSERRVQEEAR